MYGGSNGQLEPVESMYGGSGNDKINGQEGNDDMFGQSGVDEIRGGIGDDYLFAGETDLSSNEIIISGEKGDKLWGGLGKDRFDCGGLPISSIQDLNANEDSFFNCIVPSDILKVIDCTGTDTPSQAAVCNGTAYDDDMIGDDLYNIMLGPYRK
jgi:Ca2+-binding RTX toxin-like protein